MRQPVQDISEKVWTGMNQDGVYRWNRAADSWIHFDADPQNPVKLPTKEVHVLLQSERGTVSVGTHDGSGLIEFTPGKPYS